MLRNSLKQIEANLEEALCLLDAGQLEALNALLSETKVKVADTRRGEFPENIQGRHGDGQETGASIILAGRDRGTGDKGCREVSGA